MLTIAQQIEEIEAVIRKTPHHKATNAFIGNMRAKISKLKDKEAVASKKGGGGGGMGYSVKKQGDATIALVGPPSAGKSTLINKITNTKSKVAAYAFTTVTVIPGMLKYNDAYIQILDIPGLIQGASIGKGRGKEVLSVARGADLLVIMTDIKRPKAINKLVNELEGAGIRINKVEPKVRIEKMMGGGVSVTSNIKQDFDNETIKSVASEFGFKNGNIALKEKLTIDQLVDSFSRRIVYKKAIFVVNKADTDIEKKNSDYLYISAENGTGIENFIQTIWNELDLVKIYLVRRDQEPSQENPIIMKKHNTLQDVADSIGTEFASGKKLAKVWGNGSKFPGQELPLSSNVVEGMQIRFI
ncbi:50S ribosome-binding GTPase [Candidatus Microgenomates bacterium]|nr:50S ribosome-binding GTPase [Candidatus Microgenomates bacterium]